MVIEPAGPPVVLLVKQLLNSVVHQPSKAGVTCRLAVPLTLAAVQGRLPQEGGWVEQHHTALLTQVRQG